jgi:hypothetical protein
MTISRTATTPGAVQFFVIQGFVIFCRFMWSGYARPARTETSPILDCGYCHSVGEAVSFPTIGRRDANSVPYNFAR